MDIFGGSIIQNTKESFTQPHQSVFFYTYTKGSLFFSDTFVLWNSKFLQSMSSPLRTASLNFSKCSPRNRILLLEFIPYQFRVL